MSRSLRSPFPYVPLGPTELHTEPGPTWERLLADIAAAQDEVLIENYILVDGEAADALIDALTEARDRGASIRLLIDGAGSYQMSTKLRQRLQDVGALHIYHPLRLSSLLFRFRSRFMMRTHRRLILVDRKVGWTGGIAFEDPWWFAADSPFRETMIRFCGPAVAQAHQAFESLWIGDAELEQRKQSPLQAGQVRVMAQRARQVNLLAHTLLARIGKAKKRIWIETAYFIPTRRLRRAFIHAAERGVDVRLLLPGPKLHDHPSVRFASRRYYAQLLRHGIRIYEFQPSFQHGKTAVFDDEFAIVGTPNLDRWSFLWNHEIALDFQDPLLTGQLIDNHRAGYLRSIEITRESWKARPLWSRFLEYFFGIFDKGM